MSHTYIPRSEGKAAAVPTFVDNNKAPVLLIEVSSDGISEKHLLTEELLTIVANRDEPHTADLEQKIDPDVEVLKFL